MHWSVFPAFVALYAVALAHSGVMGLMGGMMGHSNSTESGSSGMGGMGGGGMMGMMNHSGGMMGGGMMGQNAIDRLVKEAVVEIYHEDPSLTDVGCMARCDALFNLEIVPQYEETTDHSCATWCLTYGTHHQMAMATEAPASGGDQHDHMSTETPEATSVSYRL